MTQGSTLTDDQIADVEASLERDPHWNQAADAAGCNPKTLYDWRQRAESYTKRFPDIPDETDPEYRYYEAVQRWTLARARVRQTLIEAVHQAIRTPDQYGRKDGKLALMMLKSCWPNDFSERVELTGAEGGPIEVSSDELRTQIEQDLARIAAKREAAGEEVEA